MNEKKQRSCVECVHEYDCNYFANWGGEPLNNERAENCLCFEKAKNFIELIKELLKGKKHESNT